MQTIVGIATPIGFGGIGIVRISGEYAPDILYKMFTPNKTGKVTPQRATLGKVYGKNYTDTAIAIFFPAPHSFTGENVAEIQAHGGYKLLQRIMNTAIEHGAIPAGRGEFSKRAFLNGKMSLEQAESIADMINAESDAEIQNAGAIMQGALREKLNIIENNLVSVRANIDACLDYPDDLPEPPQYSKGIKTAIKQIDALLSTAETGQIIKNGISVAIIGKPNAGKSSLFNAILNESRSIVTDIAGTTTDTITEQITHKGIKIKFVDTAGIRDGKTVIETEGIARTRAAANEADIVLAVLDATTELNEFDHRCISIAAGKLSMPIIVYNKTDICPPPDFATAPYLGSFYYPPAKFILIPVSAKTGKNIGRVLDKIVAMSVQTLPSANGVVITNERHARELTAAKSALQGTVAANSLDMVSTDITEALSHIGAITGTNVTEKTLDEIFSKFCLGK
jgi:tRNA modification GTPase